MAKVIGVGGVFFKSKDSTALTKWYADVLGMPLQDWGGILLLPDAMAAHPGAATVFSPFKHDTDYFAPSTKEFMINLAVDDLDGVLANCAKHGVRYSFHSSLGGALRSHFLHLRTMGRLGLPAEIEMG
jgi:hypothetical protein